VRAAVFALLRMGLSTRALFPREQIMTANRGVEAARARERELIAEARRDAAELIITPVPISPPPDCIPGFTLLREIGRGGMGTVYEALQEDLRRHVALKVIGRRVCGGGQRPSDFPEEANTLAQLNHPNIAAIYTTGCTETGLQYFVMELIDGDPLTSYARRNRLSLPGRLRLFRKICDATHYAHANDIVHRDLKPANILVDEKGNPKILDFGLARIIKSHRVDRGSPARVGHTVGTPSYMSPEQAAGRPDCEIDHRSDVYSLGVILQESLSVRRLRGDLARIVDKARANEPDERYQSAAELGDDLHRYLTHQPISCRTHAMPYLLGKLVQRHKIPSAFVATLFALVAGFGAWMTVQYAEADRLRLVAERERTQAVEARTEAQREAEKAKRIQHSLEEVIGSVNVYSSRAWNATVREMLDEAARRVEADLADQPEAEAAIRNRLGVAYAQVGLYEAAEEQLRQALEIRRELFGDEHLDVADSMEHLAYHVPCLRWWTNRYRDPHEYQEALTLYHQVLNIRCKLLGDQDNLTLKTMGGLSHLYRLAGDLAAADEIMIDGFVAGARALLSAEIIRENRDPALEVVGGQGAANDLAYARELLTAIEAFVAGSGKPLSAETIRQSTDWALLFIRVQWAAGEHQGARRFIRLFYEPLMSDPFWSYEIPSIMIGFAERQMLYGDYDTAEPILREAIAMGRKQFGASHMLVARGLEDLARVLQARGNLAESEEWLRQCLKMRRELLGEEHPFVASTLETLGLLLMEGGDLDGAESELRQCLSIRRNALGDEHWLTAYTESFLGRCLTALGQYEEAEALLVRSYPIMVAGRGATHKRTIEVLWRLIDLYEGWGKPDKAGEYRAMLPGLPQPEDSSAP